MRLTRLAAVFAFMFAFAVPARHGEDMRARWRPRARTPTSNTQSTFEQSALQHPRHRERRCSQDEVGTHERSEQEAIGSQRPPGR